MVYFVGGAVATETSVTAARLPLPFPVSTRVCLTFKHVVEYLFVFSEGTRYLVCDQWHITATVSPFPIFSLGTLSGVPRNFFRGGVQQVQLRTEITGIWGR